MIKEKKAQWLIDPQIRPYVFARDENRLSNPGSIHKSDWFQQEILFKNPLDVSEISFADQIYSIEERAFGPSNMAMPRWVFYDCAIMPGYAAGFAVRPQIMSEVLKEILDIKKHRPKNSPVNLVDQKLLPRIDKLMDMDWVPLSLFISIPTLHRGEWVAHNLCTVNSLLPKDSQFYALGFLSKAFGLWYANVEQCSGMTQWSSPALKLHSYYGHLEVIGAYAPVHSHAKTLTYRLKVNTNSWDRFFDRSEDYEFLENYRKTEYMIDPKSEKSMIELQKRIENEEGPFFLYATEVAEKKLDEPLHLYQPKDVQ